MHTKKALTLLEIIIVTVIIVVLAVSAFSLYPAAVERSKGVKARHALELIAQAEKMYVTEHITYHPDNVSSFAAAAVQPRQQHAADNYGYCGIFTAMVSSGYLDVSDGNFSSSGLNEYLQMGAIDADSDWNYDVVTASGGTTFTATATRKSGPAVNSTISLTEAGVWTNTYLF